MSIALSPLTSIGLHAEDRLFPTPQPPFGNGVNFQPSYYNNGDVDLGWELLERYPTIETIRLEIEEFAVDAAVRWIDEAASRRYQVIATYHSYEAINNKPASDDPRHMQAAITFWQTHYQKLSAAGPFIMNFMNEWGHKDITAQQYADQYNTAISAVRAFYDGPIIIDLPGSGQMASTAAAAARGSRGVNPIQDRNIILSAHIYPNSYNGRGPMTQEDLDLLRSTERVCMVGEFGENNLAGSTDWRNLVTYAKSLGWPVLAWAWAGDGGIMNVMGPGYQNFLPGAPTPNPNYYIERNYAEAVLPYL